MGSRLIATTSSTTIFRGLGPRKGAHDFPREAPPGGREIVECDENISEVLRIFFKILVMRANFGEFGDFDIDFKILEKVCDACAPILGPILENFDHRILVK